MPRSTHGPHSTHGRTLQLGRDYNAAKNHPEERLTYEPLTPELRRGATDGFAEAGCEMLWMAKAAIQMRPAVIGARVSISIRVAFAIRSRDDVSHRRFGKRGAKGATEVTRGQTDEQGQIVQSNRASLR